MGLGIEYCGNSSHSRLGLNHLICEVCSVTGTLAASKRGIVLLDEAPDEWPQPGWPSVTVAAVTLLWVGDTSDRRDRV